MHGSPLVDLDLSSPTAGHASCDKDDLLTARLVGLATQHGSIVQWGPGAGVDAYMLMNNASWAQFRKNYMATIGKAAADCGVGGIEFDYEGGPFGSDGIIPAANATAFSVLLADVKQAL